MNLLFYLIIACFLFGQLGRISFFDQKVNIYIYETLIFLSLLLLFVKYRLIPIKKYFKQIKIVFIFFIFLLSSYLFEIFEFSVFDNFLALLYFLRLIMYALFFIYMYFYLIKNKKFKIVLIKSIYILLFSVLFLCIVQYFFYPDLRNLYYLGWDPHLYRLFGLFFDTYISSAFFGIVLLFLLISKNKVIKNKYLRYFLIATYFIFILLTYSRTLYISILFIALLYFLKEKKYLNLFAFAACFMIAVIIIPKPFGEGVNLKRTFSIESRYRDYNNALVLWKKKPLFGYGYNRIRAVKAKNNMLKNTDIASHSASSFHSSYLIILVSGGLIGLVFFLMILGNILNFSYFSGYLIIFLGLLSLSDNVLLHPFVLFTSFIFISLSRKLF